MNDPVKRAEEERAMMLQDAASGKLSVQIAEEQLQGLLREIEEAASAMERPLATIRALCGPELVGVPAHLFTMMNFGTGYFRHCRDVLNAMFRSKRLAAKQAACPHDSGVRYKGHDAFCALCGLAFVPKKGGGFQPPQ